MKNKRFLAVVLTTVLGIGTAIIVRQTWATPKASAQSKQPLATLKEDEIPDRIFYGETFSLLAKLKNLNDYQERAMLNDEETDFLRVTTEQCAERIARQDEKAQSRIVALQQSFKSKPPRSAPRIPTEITQLQAERDAIILNCRDVLRARLGDEKFGQFRSAAKSIVKIQASQVR